MPDPPPGRKTPPFRSCLKPAAESLTGLAVVLEGLASLLNLAPVLPPLLPNVVVAGGYALAVLVAAWRMSRAPQGRVGVRLARLRARQAAVAAFLYRLAGGRRDERGWRVVLRLVLVAAAVTGGWAFVRWAERADLGTCGHPVQVRLAVPVEQWAALTDLAARYERERAGSSGCARVRVAVERAPAPAELTRAAQDGWIDEPGAEGVHRPLVAVHPDLIVTAHAEHLAELVADRETLLSAANLGTIATSPLVVAVTPKVAEGLTQTDKRESLERLRSLLGGRLARPRGDLSESGLVATDALYPPAEIGKDPNGDAGNLNDINAELGLSPAGVPLSDAVDLLCHARQELADGEDPALAMVVPEHLALTFARMPECGEPEPGAAVSSFYPPSLPVLAYDLVHLRWRAQQSYERERWTEDLAAWLAAAGDRLEDEHRLRRADGGFRSVSTPVADVVAPGEVNVRALQDRIARAHPRTSFAIALDASGSMADQDALGRSALELAKSAARDLLGRLQEGRDEAAVLTFSAAAPGARLPGDTFRELDQAVERVRTTGSDLRLDRALDQAARRLADSGRERILVLLTDGGGAGALPPEPSPRRDFTVLALLTGGGDCGELRERLLQEGDACHRIAPSDDPADVVHEELIKLWLTAGP
ncbi:vWA domain-containing protein [Nonomuraea sp. NPDC050310]|uniref:vWA domain-containing protein n=1 Tax=unclassified Nonomuraea TaxID=2593643 RepID=UPI0033DA7557